MIDPALAACAPHVSPATLTRIIQVESSGNPLAVNVNRRRGHAPYPTPRIRSPEHGSQVARDAISKGFNVDLGLMQVNSRNLQGLGYSIEQMFMPCTNVTAGAKILTDNYSRAARSRGHGQPALLAALSAYNTGSFENGFTNGYIARYFNIRSAIITLPSAPIAGAPVNAEAPPNPFTSDLTVFSRERSIDATERQAPDGDSGTGRADRAKNLLADD